MKFLIVAVFVVLAIAQAFASENVQANIDESIREKKAAYGGSSYSAPPCPSNYLFSCSPHLQPVGCSQGSYGSAGAYSENYPQYAVPQWSRHFSHTYGNQI